MVTPDVSEAARSVLRRLYTEVVPIEYMTVTVGACDMFRSKKMQEYCKTWNRASWPKSTVYNFNNTKKYACWMRMLFFRVVWTLYLRCRHQRIFPHLLVALSEFIPFRLANWRCPMWSYCKGFSRKRWIPREWFTDSLANRRRHFRQFKDSIEDLQKKHEVRPNGICALG